LRRPPIGCHARCGAEVRAQGEQGGGFCGRKAGREWWEKVECYEVVGAEGEVVCSLIFVGQMDRCGWEGDWFSGTTETDDYSSIRLRDGHW
jgi:hypothetical protein